MDQRSLPMCYSFLGHEPDHLVCCDLPECAIRIQLNSPDEITYKRLNCGHSFHFACLQPRDPANDPFVPNRTTCPICHPLLEERIRELSTTVNRWVPGLEKNWILVCSSKQAGLVSPSNKRRNVLCFIRTLLSPFYVGISQVMHWTETKATVATKMMMTVSQINSRVAATMKRTKATKANWTRCWPHFEHVLDHCSKNDPGKLRQSSGTSTKSLKSRPPHSHSLKERIAKHFLSCNPVVIKFANHLVDLHSMWNECTVLKTHKVLSFIVSSRLSMTFRNETGIKRSLSVLAGDESTCFITFCEMVFLESFQVVCDRC